MSVKSGLTGLPPKIIDQKPGLFLNKTGHLKCQTG